MEKKDKIAAIAYAWKTALDTHNIEQTNKLYDRLYYYHLIII